MRTIQASTVALAILLASTALPSLAWAQVQPTFRTLDANGVDLVQGDFITGFVEGSIGAGEGELVLRRQLDIALNTGSSQWDRINLTISGGTTSVTIGSRTDLFPAANARGITLTATASAYEYRSPDGTRISFAYMPAGSGTTNMCDGSGTQPACTLYPGSITSPDGRTITFDYEWWTHCIQGQQPDEFDCTYTPQLRTVANDRGYAIQFSYASGGGSGPTPPPATFYQRTGAQFSTRWSAPRHRRPASATRPCRPASSTSATPPAVSGE